MISDINLNSRRSNKIFKEEPLFKLHNKKDKQRNSNMAKGRGKIALLKDIQMANK